MKSEIWVRASLRCPGRIQCPHLACSRSRTCVCSGHHLIVCRHEFFQPDFDEHGFGLLWLCPAFATNAGKHYIWLRSKIDDITFTYVLNYMHLISFNIYKFTPLSNIRLKELSGVRQALSYIHKDIKCIVLEVYNSVCSKYVCKSVIYIQCSRNI